MFLHTQRASSQRPLFFINPAFTHNPLIGLVSCISSTRLAYKHTFTRVHVPIYTIRDAHLSRTYAHGPPRIRATHPIRIGAEGINLAQLIGSSLSLSESSPSRKKFLFRHRVEKGITPARRALRARITFVSSLFTRGDIYTRIRIAEYVYVGDIVLFIYELWSAWQNAKFRIVAGYMVRYIILVQYCSSLRVRCFR